MCEFEPGDIARIRATGELCYIAARHGDGSFWVMAKIEKSCDPEELERVTICGPGEVPVKVDDLSLSAFCFYDEESWMPLNPSTVAAIRAARAKAALSLEPKNAPVKAETETLPSETTVRLACPECGETLPEYTVKTGKDFHGIVYAMVVDGDDHRCKPAQPDEPTEFGARVTVTLPDGTREKWCRILAKGEGFPDAWAHEQFDTGTLVWPDLCGRGTVTLGWEAGE